MNIPDWTNTNTGYGYGSGDSYGYGIGYGSKDIITENTHGNS
jgi:hypothetical protein